MYLFKCQHIPQWRLIYDLTKCIYLPTLCNFSYYVHIIYMHWSAEIFQNLAIFKTLVWHTAYSKQSLQYLYTKYSASQMFNHLTHLFFYIIGTFNNPIYLHFLLKKCHFKINISEFAFWPINTQKSFLMGSFLTFFYPLYKVNSYNNYPLTILNIYNYL